MNWIYDILDAIPRLWRIVEIKTEAMFTRQLWTYSLQLFRRQINEFAFIQDFADSIADQLNKAWREGADSMGVSPDEFTTEDRAEINSIIVQEYERVLGLATDIINLRDNAGTLDQFRSEFKARIELWGHRYTDVQNQARVWFGKKQKLKWVLGETEKHCESCMALNGIVAYSYEWDQSLVRPQNPPNQALECGGWRCDCHLEKTMERHTVDALEKIMNIAVVATLSE
jgi:hypothetical protein